MDYCSSCRRHLNGALVCPGCGAYAPDIDPSADPAATAVPMAGLESADPDTWHECPPGEETDTVGVPPLTEGRAARRRQRARWKKTQRRAMVATAVALVGGSLTLISMDQQTGDRARAATAPEDPGTGAVEPSGREARPATAKPETPRSTTPTPSATERAGRRDAAGTARATPASVRPDDAAAPRTTAISTPQPRTTAPASSGEDTQSGYTATTDGTEPASSTDRTDPTTGSTPASAPPSANDEADSPGSGGSGAEEPTNQPDTTSPQQELCVLVLCVG